MQGTDGVCVCDEGYAGESCENCDEENGYHRGEAGNCTDDPCDPDPCNGHGDCISGSCQCDEGYALDRCASCSPGYLGYPDSELFPLVSRIALTVPPLPPSNLTSFVTTQGVQLRWLPGGKEAYAQVVVLRGTGEEALEPIAELPGGVLMYLDAGAEPGIRYLYTVVGRDAAGNVSLQPRPVAGKVPVGDAPVSGDRR